VPQGFKFAGLSSLMQSVSVKKFQGTCARILHGGGPHHRLSIVEISHETKNEAQNWERCGWGGGGNMISIVVETELTVQQNSETTHWKGPTSVLHNN
jgi:hypothetical protein